MPSEPDIETEEPLDPATERVRAKMARLLMGSIGVMILGILAVFLAILYKLGLFGEPASTATAPGTPIDAVVMLPAGAQTISSSYADGMLSVTVRLPGGAQEVRLYRMPGGEPAGRVQLAVPAQ